MILLIGRMSSAAAVVVLDDAVVAAVVAWYAAFACCVDWIAAVEIARPAAAVMMRRASERRLVWMAWCVWGFVFGWGIGWSPCIEIVFVAEGFVCHRPGGGWVGRNGVVGFWGLTREEGLWFRVWAESAGNGQV